MKQKYRVNTIGYMVAIRGSGQSPGWETDWDGHVYDTKPDARDARDLAREAGYWNAEVVHLVIKEKAK